MLRLEHDQAFSTKHTDPLYLSVFIFINNRGKLIDSTAFSAPSCYTVCFSQYNTQPHASPLCIPISISSTMPSLCLAFPVLLILFIFSFSSAHLFHDDGQSLLEFAGLITSDPYRSMDDWNPAVPLCNWTAVTCSHRHNRVVALNLTSMDLGGSISPYLGNLSFLRTLDLSRNALHGHIPTQLGRLFRLRTLWLDHNQLEGNIPMELGFLTHLQQLSCGTNSLTGTIPSVLSNISTLIVLAISTNNLTGSIPKELGLLTSLQTLYLYENDLSGTIPNSLSNISTLTDLEIYTNKLIGNIPQELGMLPSLQMLYLYENDLSGTIPTYLFNISTLIDLEISTNRLTGSIPQELGLLTSLQWLYLDENELSGTIPTSLSNISALTDLEIQTNNLTGSIPQELGLLTRLQIIYLFQNELSGTVPTSLSNISTLTELHISTNHFIGNIPQELGLLTSLQKLNLFKNEFSGTIPASLSNISTLFFLGISENKLIGSIPQELGLLTSLQSLYLHTNELSGIIPTSLSNISTLIELIAYRNKLTGNIPSLSNLFNLIDLYLWGNQLSGNIPNSIGNCSKLEHLDLGGNKLSGSVPVELGKLSLLERLYLQYNQLLSGSSTTMPFIIALTNCSHLKILDMIGNKLTGVLPLAIGKLSTNLSYLSLASNMIEGNIPPHIGNISSLTFLNLSENLLSGSIPSLRNLKNLERLALGNNKLEGNIPNDFEQLERLGLLDISNNILSGNIPNTLAPLKQLRSLLLHHNRLSGSIPANLGNCTNLELLDLSHNILIGSIPREIAGLYNLHFYLNLSCNSLEGSLPMEIGKVAMAQAIDISANQLTGVIPTTLGSCVELLSLSLSQNALQGSIPDSLGNLQSLMNLDLSSNSLSSTIPVALKKLKMLQYLNLSFNNLIGEIPEGGIFANQTIVMSLIGNPNLCGSQVFGFPACQTPRGHPTILKRVLLPVSGAIAFILCCLFFGFLWKGNMHIQNFDFSLAIFPKLEHQRISYQELHIATNGFNEANLLGTSNFGLVYKGILSDDTIIAVKVLQLQNDQAEKTFKAECSVLQKVRHRNLVRIITSCSNLHFKGLVFEFMSNGSLHEHLYPNRDDNNGEDVCELGLKTRLDIAIDVAHAMEYLHHDCFVQVVHCDIKPSNVLLDEDMLGHVTDFGIARLFGESFTNSLTSSLTLRGSMGYIAPEYGLGGTVSTQGDVYSYGILLLEMLSRKQPTSDMFVGDLNLYNWVNFAFPNRLKEVIDSSLFSEVDGDEFEENNIYKCLLSLLRVGLLCSKHSPEERPTMRVVVRMLESIREDLVANEVVFSGLRRSISSLLYNTNATRNDALASDDQSSTF